jgi:hypothetical protein
MPIDSITPMLNNTPPAAWWSLPLTLALVVLVFNNRTSSPSENPSNSPSTFYKGFTTKVDLQAEVDAYCDDLVNYQSSKYR